MPTTVASLIGVGMSLMSLLPACVTASTATTAPAIRQQASARPVSSSVGLSTTP